MKRKAKPKAKAKPAPIVTARPAKASSVLASLPLGPIKPKDLRQVSDVTGLPMRDIDLALWRLIGHGATILPPDPETPADAP